MKNISPEKTNNSMTRTIIMFIILFLISEFFIVKPLKNKIIRQQEEKVEIEALAETERIKKEEGNNIIGEDVIIENDYLRIKVNTKGLILNNVDLKKYNKTVNSDEKVKLLNDNYNISLNWLSFTNGLKLPDINSLWKVEKDNDKTNFIYDNGDGVIFKVILSLDEKYMLNVEQIVENNKYNKVYVKPFWQIMIKQDDNNVDYTSFNGGIGVFNKEKIEEIKIKKMKKNNVEYEKFNWAGFTNKYWLTAIINGEKYNGTINYLKKLDTIKVQYTTKSNVIVAKNSFVGTKNKIFIGAKDKNILKEYQNKENIQLFDRSIDFGMFYILAKPMDVILDFCNKITHNFGIAIIILTIIIKMLLYPTVKKSFISIAAMKKAQPEMQKIQETYKNDRIGMQQELVKLYKKYNLNPLSGILPLFIQIPVFFSLYKVISVSLNMRQAPFFGYIKDLASADPTTIFNLFGLLPYEIGYKVGLLPCIMALSMYIQQKITDNMQKTDNINMSEQMKATNSMLKYLPLVFLFIFSGFPAGLLLYWIFNNIITILQQLYITKKYIDKK